MQALIFWATLPTEQNGGENRELKRSIGCIFVIFHSHKPAGCINTHYNLAAAQAGMKAIKR